jgi:hypothetical protein
VGSLVRSPLLPCHVRCHRCSCDLTRHLPSILPPWCGCLFVYIICRTKSLTRYPFAERVREPALAIWFVERNRASTSRGRARLNHFQHPTIASSENQPHLLRGALRATSPLSCIPWHPELLESANEWLGLGSEAKLSTTGPHVHSESCLLFCAEIEMPMLQEPQLLRSRQVP